MTLPLVSTQYLPQDTEEADSELRDEMIAWLIEVATSGVE